MNKVRVQELGAPVPMTFGNEQATTMPCYAESDLDLRKEEHQL